MDFETYERLKRAEYAAFAETVASILTAAIRVDPHLRLQHVQHRAKDPTSLKRKLAGSRLLDTQTLDADIKDLAGCRVVFYTNSDVNRFISSGLFETTLTSIGIGRRFTILTPIQTKQTISSFRIIMLCNSKRIAGRCLSTPCFVTCGVKFRFKPYSTTRGPKWRTI